MKKPHRPKRPKRSRPKRRSPKNHGSRRRVDARRAGIPGRRAAPGAGSSSKTRALQVERAAASKPPSSKHPERAQERPRPLSRTQRPTPPTPGPSSLLAATWTFSAFRALSALLCVWMIVALAIGPSLATVGCSEPPKEGPPPIEEGTIRGLSEADTLFFYDQRGTLLAETSGTGEVRARFNAYPYGATRHQSSAESRLYANSPRDTGVGLDHMGARFYAPDLGAWTIPDPVLINAPEAVATGEFGTANPYAYANLNPVIAVDDDGNFWHIAVGAGLGAAFGGGVEAARQYSVQGGFKGWDWGRIGAAASGGAVSGAITAAVPTAGLAGFLGVQGTASAAEGATVRLIESGGASAGTLRDVAVDAAMGVFTAGALRGGSGIIKNALPSKPPTALLGEVRVLDSTAALNPRAVVQPRQLPAGPPAPPQLPAPRPNTTFIDPHGNALRGPPGATITGSPDGRFVQVRDAKGVHTGTRIDQGHKPAGHPDPRAQRPHGHVDGVTNPDGTPWLPIKQ